eukprot:gnl/MRDRNA2_/MRDRNA2_99937_c0_seq1.p1 gnl/MRDRNA2_/MRDRNA2_99937_c0~~gnl/MRDRNA2_/MRDRNA2_99937_c0_seq1.p1  ORF type:complete len:439 (-),score=83.08 gnl/MRDRNA2_/MRDRNA2_99937_c0_seq1:469-1785(-)
MFSGEYSEMFPYADIDGSLHDVIDPPDLAFSSLECGDPYRECDDNTRGVPMGQPTNLDAFPVGSVDKSDFFSGKDSKGPFTFYNEESWEYSLSEKCSESEPPFLQPWRASSLPAWEVPNTNISSSISTNFDEHHVPPRPPSSTHFFFAPTTFFVEGCSPQQIGKSLVAFLTTEIVASVTKVRPQKYSIKAEVFHEGMSCSLKVKVYSYDGQYAIEVHRQAGDAFVLQTTYHRLKAYITEKCGGVCGQRDASVLSTQRMLVGAESMEDDDTSVSEMIAPPLAMATVTGLEAEAASALAKIMKGGQRSAEKVLEVPDHTATALKSLLATGCVDTVYPAACCVSDLALLSKASSVLAQDGLLQTLALEAIAELRKSQGLVGIGLAHAVQVAVQCCVGSLTLSVARELQLILRDAINDELLQRNAIACGHLEQAWLDTKLVA